MKSIMEKLWNNIDRRKQLFVKNPSQCYLELHQPYMERHGAEASLWTAKKGRLHCLRTLKQSSTGVNLFVP